MKAEILIDCFESEDFIEVKWLAELQAFVYEGGESYSEEGGSGRGNDADEATFNALTFFVKDLDNDIKRKKACRKEARKMLKKMSKRRPDSTKNEGS